MAPSLLLLLCGLAPNHSMAGEPEQCATAPTSLTSFLSRALAQLGDETESVSVAARFAEEQFHFKDLASAREEHFLEMGLAPAVRHALLSEIERAHGCLPRWAALTDPPGGGAAAAGAAIGGDSADGREEAAATAAGRCDAAALLSWIRAGGGGVDERLHVVGDNGCTLGVAPAGGASSSTIPAGTALLTFAPALMLRAGGGGQSAGVDVDAAVGGSIATLLRAHRDSAAGLVRPGGSGAQQELTWLAETRLAVALLAERARWRDALPAARSPPSRFGPLLACLPHVLHPERCALPLCTAPPAGGGRRGGEKNKEENEEGEREEHRGAGPIFDPELLPGMAADARALARVRSLVRWGAVGLEDASGGSDSSGGAGVVGVRGKRGAAPSAAEWRWALAMVASHATAVNANGTLALLPTLELTNAYSYDDGAVAATALSLRAASSGAISQHTDTALSAGAKIISRKTMPVLNGEALSASEIFFLFGAHAFVAAFAAEGSVGRHHFHHLVEAELAFSSRLLVKAAQRVLGHALAAGGVGLAARLHPLKPLALSVTFRVQWSGALVPSTLALFRLLALPQSQLQRHLPPKATPVNAKRKQVQPGRAGAGLGAVLGVRKPLSPSHEKRALTRLAGAVEDVANQHRDAQARLAVNASASRSDGPDARRAAMVQFHSACMVALQRTGKAALIAAAKITHTLKSYAELQELKPSSL